jgi:hypothetical protein
LTTEKLEDGKQQTSAFGVLGPRIGKDRIGERIALDPLSWEFEWQSLGRNIIRSSLLPMMIALTPLVPRNPPTIYLRNWIYGRGPGYLEVLGRIPSYVT